LIYLSLRLLFVGGRAENYRDARTKTDRYERNVGKNALGKRLEERRALMNRSLSVIIVMSETPRPVIDGTRVRGPVKMFWVVNAENPNKPFAMLEPFCPLLVLEYNPKDCNILASGMMTGQVAVWDSRKVTEPVAASPSENSHRDPCAKLLWINSKTGTEFFSASRDGQVGSPSPFGASLAR
jgi:hypothetical protein